MHTNCLSIISCSETAINYYVRYNTLNHCFTLFLLCYKCFIFSLFSYWFIHLLFFLSYFMKWQTDLQLITCWFQLIILYDLKVSNDTDLKWCITQNGLLFLVYKLLNQSLKLSLITVTASHLYCCCHSQTPDTRAQTFACGLRFETEVTKLTQHQCMDAVDPAWV